ncbi:MAG: rRNA pseudouridine synthase [Deltaproteobacteria bacterium]|nr:rRNA pseudouridine synthase [Deltaproteobacteria bacterium]
MRLDKLLSGLGYCSRSETSKLIKQGRVAVPGVIGKLKADTKVNPDGVLVDGEPLDPLPGIVVAFNKPAGYVCTTSAAEGQTVYDLLPERFSRRNPRLATVGRLDKDTSGLLLLSDDGAFVHKMTSPKHAIEKLYRATLEKPLEGHEEKLFVSGEMMLEGEAKPLRPARMRAIEERLVELVITEGRYHQVRRMFAAVGNHVLQLQRIAIGPLTLEDLPQGSHRILSKAEIATLLS